MLRINDGRGIYVTSYIDGWFALFFTFDEEMKGSMVESH